MFGVWFGLVWFGLVWFGLVWFGLIWFGLVRIGLVFNTNRQEEGEGSAEKAAGS